MRPGQGPSGGGVPAPGPGQGRGQGLLQDGAGLALCSAALPLPERGNSGLGEGPITPGVDLGLEGGQGERPGFGQARAADGETPFQGVKPDRVSGPVGEQPKSLAQGLFIGLGEAGVGGLGGEDQPVQEPASLARSLKEEPVLGRGQPGRADMVSQARRGGGFALKPHGAAARPGRLRAHAQADRLAAHLEPGSDGPGTPSRLLRRPAADLGKGGVTEPPAGGQEGDGLQYVGLARPVGSGEHDRAAVELQLRPVVGPEVG